MLRRTAADVAGIDRLARDPRGRDLLLPHLAGGGRGARRSRGSSRRFPISLMVAASIFQMTFMIEIGAVKRIVAGDEVGLAAGPRRADPDDQRRLRHAGHRPRGDAGLDPAADHDGARLLELRRRSPCPAIGYDSLCTYALLAIPAVVFTDVLAPIVKDAGDHPDAARHGVSLRAVHPARHDLHRARDVLDRRRAGRWWLRGLVPALLTGRRGGSLLLADGRARPRAPDRRRGRGGDHPRLRPDAQAARSAGLRRERVSPRTDLEAKQGMRPSARGQSLDSAPSSSRRWST